MTRVSVCLATYNGADHLLEQLDSIIGQLEADDEVIAVDDCSSDRTVDILRAYDDRRLRLVQLPRNRGHVGAFEQAVRSARGEFVVLSDQDDLWAPGRLDLMVSALADADLVAGNYRSFGDVWGPPDHPLGPHLDDHPWRNVAGLAGGRRPYFGSCMAFRASFLEIALPFPPHTQAHDHWLAISANLAGTVRHIEEAVTLRRTHAHNLSQDGRPWPAILGTRAIQVAHVLRALRLRSTKRERS